MRRIGAAMAEPWGKPHGMTVGEVCDVVDRLNAAIPPDCDYELERELDLHGHLLVHEAMVRKRAERGE